MNIEQKIDKWIALIIVAIIISGSYIYVEQTKLNFKKEIILNNQVNRKKCLTEAEKRYTERWNKTCKMDKLGPKCALENDSAVFIKNEYKDARNECIKMYPAN